MAYIGKDEYIFRSEKNTIYSIQVLRGVAAVLVVLYHATRFFSALYQVSPLGGFFLFGFSGVHLFFVLSGFIIFTIHFHDIGKPIRYLPYIIKRFIRIYPNYWVTLSILSFWVMFTGSTITIQDFYQNMSLMKGPNIWVNPVCWTLVFEVLFYIIFSFLIINKIFGGIIIFCWVLGVAATNLFDLQYSFFSFLNIAFHKYTVLFMIGVVVSYVVMRLKQLKPVTGNKISYTACLGGLFVFSFTAVYCFLYKITNWDLWIVTLGFGLASGCFMTCVLSDTLERLFQRQNLLTSLGDASYSIYLLHYIFLREVISYSKSHFSMSEPTTITLAFIAVCAMAVLVGWLFYFSIERPLLKFMQRWLSTGRTLDKTARPV